MGSDRHSQASSNGEPFQNEGHVRTEPTGTYTDAQNSQGVPQTEVCQQAEDDHAAAAPQPDPDFVISEPYRYFLLVVGSVGCLLASLSYTFGLFSMTMMRMGGLNMTQVTTVGTVMLVFSYFTLPYAFVMDYFGPKPVLVIGTILLPLGCLLMALTFNGNIQATTATFSVFMGIMGGGCIVFDIGTVVAVLSWFPTYRGPVVAIMKTFAGLGSAIVGTLQHAFFDSYPAGFFFLLMAMSLVFGLFCVFSMRLPPYHLTAYQNKHLSEEEKVPLKATMVLFLRKSPCRRRAAIALCFIVFLIIFLPLQSALVSYCHLGKGPKIAFAVVVIAACAFYPVICLPLRCLGGMETPEELEEKKRKKELARRLKREEEMRQNDVGNDDGDARALEAAPEVKKDDLDYISPMYQGTFVQNLLTFRLWAIFLVCFSIIGAQLVIIFHYTFICAALRGKPTDENFKTLLATLNGVGSAIGRLLLSGLEMWSQRRPPEQRIPITASLFFPLGFTILGLVFYLVLPGDGLALGHFVMALGNGTAAAAAVLVFRGVFAKDPATHYNFGFLAAMVSAILLNRVAYAEWYAFKMKKYTGSTCFKKECVLMPLLLMLGLNVASLIGSIYVHWDYATYCRQVLKERAEARAAAAALSTEPQPNQADAEINGYIGKDVDEGSEDSSDVVVGAEAPQRRD